MYVSLHFCWCLSVGRIVNMNLFIAPLKSINFSLPENTLAVQFSVFRKKYRSKKTRFP